MSTKSPLKINQLISQWPKGVVFTQKYLNQKGYYHDLVKKYKKSRWIEPIGTGAFKLNRDVVEWYGGLYALQAQLGLNAHACGKTALELKGYVQYLRPRNALLCSIGSRIRRSVKDNGILDNSSANWTRLY